MQFQAITASAPEGNHDTRVVKQRSFRYRPDGLLIGTADHLFGERHLHLDAMGRVTTVTSSAWSNESERYAYDLAGNVTFGSWVQPPVTSTTALTGDLDARGEREYAGTLIRHAGTVRYEHDAQGRVVLKQERRLSAKPRTWRFAWEADDRLTGVVTPDGDRWRYRYDPLGRRIAKDRLADDGQTVAERVEFTWDGAVIAEQNKTQKRGPDDRIPGGILTTWDWEPGSFRPIAQRELHIPEGVSQQSIGERFHAIVTDRVGTPTDLVSADGDIAWHRRSSVWGMDTADRTGPVECQLRFPGQYFDAETGTHYNFFRHYEPLTARYLSNDPTGLALETNPHAYVDNPLAWIDPLGLGTYAREIEALTSRAARRSAMREQRIPTSQQPRSQMSTVAGHQYVYDVPAPGGGTRTMIVTDQTTDRVAGHGPHWEAGPAKIPERYDGLGRLRVTSGKSKFEYG